MSEFDKESVFEDDNELEQLLSNASPRAVPDHVASTAARDAVHAEWRKVTGRHQRRQNYLKLAVAASILLTVFSVFNVFRPAAVDTVHVATMQKNFGSIYFLGEQSKLTLAGNSPVVYQGQTIVTSDDAGIALAWNSGGSLRLDKETEVEFLDDRSIFLHSGSVYFDSRPSELIAGTKAASRSGFVIRTDRGDVTHVGTQFMTEVTTDALTVSVREGRVTVDGLYQQQIALRGEQLTFDGRRQPFTASISEHGELWSWVARTSPDIDVDGQSIESFLAWAGRELGYEVEFADESVLQHAQVKTLKGSVDSGPIDALHMLMMTTELDHRIDDAEGVIYVSNSE